MSRGNNSEIKERSVKKVYRPRDFDMDSASDSEGDQSECIYIDPQGVQRDENAPNCFLKFKRANNHDIQLLGEELSNAGITCFFLDSDKVKVKLTAKEKKIARRAYREIYKLKPEVQAETERRKHDPEIKEARRLYGLRPDVIERKRAIARIKREYHAKAKLDSSISYDTYCLDLIEALPKIEKGPRKKRVKKNHTPSDSQITDESVKTHHLNESIIIDTVINK